MSYSNLHSQAHKNLRSLSSLSYISLLIRLPQLASDLNTPQYCLAKIIHDQILKVVGSVGLILFISHFVRFSLPLVFI